MVTIHLSRMRDRALANGGWSLQTGETNCICCRIWNLEVILADPSFRVCLFCQWTKVNAVIESFHSSVTPSGLS
jgi:hypothetical protein